MHPSQHTSQWASGPATHNKTYASSLQETDSLFHSYEHLAGVPNHEEGLMRLRRIASLVKPIMRKRGWQVRVLTEFLPEMPNLLGLNINRGYKICIRLRYNHAPGTFLPIEQTIDTMLHELSHIIWGAHDANFHALWDELRNEHETLLMKGYTGEGFLTKGNRLGGGRVPPQSEIKRLARANAEKRRVLQKGSGQRVGGGSSSRSANMRQVIADAAERRNKIDKGCASGTADAGKIADHASQQAFKTQADEDDANNRAIAEALLDLMEEDEMKKALGTFTSPGPSGGLGWHPEKGLYPVEATSTNLQVSEEEQMRWAFEESMKSNRPAQSQSLVDKETRPGSGRDVPAPKRLKSRNNSSNVVRFRDPNASRSGTSAAGVGNNFIDLTNDSSSHNQATDSWTCEICTCINPAQFLSCDACAVERPASMGKAKFIVPRKPVPQNDTPAPSTEDSGWYCRECATYMEHKWWTCSGCGLMKDTS